EARLLHFPKLNCSAWFDGSDLVGIELWGGHETRWCSVQEMALRSAAEVVLGLAASVALDLAKGGGEVVL
ncbi:MAG: hypothetical protein KF810_20710, partial [Rhizobiaceae bacterium]|nr:hypothetical protein [Rhizobiaceae bacterium]